LYFDEHRESLNPQGNQIMPPSINNVHLILKEEGDGGSLEEILGVRMVPLKKLSETTPSKHF